MQGGAAVLACPWRSWSCSVECRRTGLFCFSVRNPPPAPLPPRQEQTSVALLLLQAGKFCGSFGWKWAELQPSSCHLPCNLCSFPDSHLHCQKWASSRLPPAGRAAALPAGQGSPWPRTRCWQLPPLPLPSPCRLHCLVVLCFHPPSCTSSSDYSCSCFTRKQPPLADGWLGCGGNRESAASPPLGETHRLLMTWHLLTNTRACLFMPLLTLF